MAIPPSMIPFMDGRRDDPIGSGSGTRPLIASSEPLPRHPGLTPEPVSGASEAEATVAKPATAQAVAEPTGIGQLHYIEPRELWPAREGYLLQWLAQNPEPLAVATGLKLRPLADGAPQSDESVVLQTDTGDPVVVVLDLGESSDNALGRLMRTVAATDAKAAIWAVGSARSEHLASMSWLNRMVAERSFIVQLRAVRIDDSRPALILGPMLRPPRHDDRPPLVPPAEASTSPQFGRRADDWPTVSLIERGADPRD
jgi:hypothetical protein